MKQHIRTLLVCLAATAAACTPVDPMTEDPFITRAEGEAAPPSENPFWDWCEAYPGAISKDIPVIEDTLIVVKGDVPNLVYYAPEEPVLHSTGLFVRMDETILVTVPEGVTDLNYQIGICQPLAQGQIRLRLDDVRVKGLLQPGENHLTSSYGGYLYFYYAPGQANRADVEVHVSGAIEGNSYIDGQTRFGPWTEQMRLYAQLYDDGSDSLAFLPWVELRSDKFIINVKVNTLKELYRPDQLLEQYGKMVDAYHAFAGYPTEDYPPMRAYVDLQAPDYTHTTETGVGLHTDATLRNYGGYPLCYGGANKTPAGYEKQLMNRDVLTFNLEGTDNDADYWMYYGFANTFLGEWRDVPFLKDELRKIGYYYYAYQNGLNPNRTINFTGNLEKLHKRLNAFWYNRSDEGVMDMWYYFIDYWPRTTLFMLMAQEYGWGIFPYIFSRSRELGFDYNPEDSKLYHIQDLKLKPELIGDYQYTQSANDHFVMSACEYANTNLLPLFDTWKFPASAYARSYCAHFAPLTKSLWDSCPNDVRPTYDKLTPNQSFERPAPPVQYQWYQGEAKPLTIEFEDPITHEIVRTNTYSAYTDNDITTAQDVTVAHQKPALVGANAANVKNANSNFYKNNPQYKPYAAQLGALSDLERNRLRFKLHSYIEYTDGKPRQVDALRWIHGLIDNSIDEVSEFEYFDLDTQTWEPMTPGGTRLRDAATGFTEVFHFDKVYTSNKFRFVMRQRIRNTPTNMDAIKIRDITLGCLTYADPNAATEDQPSAE